MINKLKRQRIEELLKRGLSRLEIYEPTDKVRVESERDKVFVQYRKGNSVGLTGTTHFALQIEERVCYLLSIGRDEKLRGKGVGKQLYELVEGLCVDLNLESIQLAFLGNGREKYWESLGFIRIRGYDQMEKVLLRSNNV